jgi:uncharacterized protein
MQPDLEEARRVVLQGLRDIPAKVYLFGSWAKGKARRTSDIDIAILPEKPAPRWVLSEIREALEESKVLYPVDLVDLLDVPEDFRRRVLSEGILWNG